MILQVELIDPQKAKQWLSQCNTRNRRLRKHQIEKITRQILEGKWVLNADTIKFTSNGVLIDGQHRLSAVVASNTAIHAAVAYGVDDPDAFKTIDTNVLKRGPADLGKNIKHANVIFAVARRLMHWDNTDNKAEFSLTSESYSKITVADVVDYAEANQSSIQEIYEYMAKSLPCRKCKAGSALITALVICSRADDVVATVFMDGLITGTGLTENSSIALLRDRLIDPPERRGVKWELEIMALTIKSFNKFLKDEPLKTLRWRRVGDCPEKFPTPIAG